MTHKRKVERLKDSKVEKLRASVRIARRTEDAIYSAIRAGWPRAPHAHAARPRSGYAALCRAALVLFSFLLFPFSLYAQFTEVSGTITDPNGVPYAAAVVQATFMPSGGSPTLNGAQCCANAAATTRSNGAFSMDLADNNVVVPGGSQWRFTVSLSPGVLPPLGTGPQSFSVTLTITGATQSITAQLTAAAPALTQGSFGGGAVSSVFGRTGVVAATDGDYSLGLLANVDVTGQAQNDMLCNTDGTNWASCKPGIATNAQTVQNYTIVCASDRGRNITRSYAAAMSDTLPQATGDCGAGWYAYVTNVHASSALTITPTTSTINGAASLAISTQFETYLLKSDGANYLAFRMPISGGGGDSVQFNATGVNATINFTNRVGTGTIPGYTWTLTPGTPDTAQFAMDAATASLAGVVTNAAQTFAGAKTFTGNVTANILSSSSSETNTLTDIGPNSAISTTQSIHGWQGSSPGGALVAHGGDQSIGGPATFRGGNATAGPAGAASLMGGDTSEVDPGGNLTIRPGASTNATPGNPGRLVFGGVANDGGTVTSGALQCVASNRATADCAVSATNFLGIALSTGVSMHIQEHGLNNVTVPLDVTTAGDCNGTNCTTVVGHFVCSSANVAGQVQPQTTACAAGRQVGIIFVAESAVTVLAIGSVWLQFK